MTPPEIIAKEAAGDDWRDGEYRMGMGEIRNADELNAGHRAAADRVLEALISAGYRILGPGEWDKEADWQPIETAPKDGTLVLLFTRWAGDEIHPEPFDGIQIGCWDEGNLTGDIWHREAEWSVDKIGTATHWRPLPAPPAIRALAKEKQG